MSVTVTLGSRTVSLEQVTDARISTALRATGQELGRRLASIHCPVHHKNVSNVRVHFGARGEADLKYDSCCVKLGEEVGKALG